MTDNLNLINVKSYNKLRDFEVDLLSIMVKHFCERNFYNTKPKFKFQRLLITDTFYHFFFNIGGIDYKVAFSKKEIKDFFDNRIVKKYSLPYFRFYEKNIFVSVNYDTCDFWDVLGGIEFDKSSFELEEKKTYGFIGYFYVKIRRLLEI